MEKNKGPICNKLSNIQLIETKMEVMMRICLWNKNKIEIDSRLKSIVEN